MMPSLLSTRKCVSFKADKDPVRRCRVDLIWMIPSLKSERLKTLPESCWGKKRTMKKIFKMRKKRS
jgi:hypothetical protein